MSHIDTIRHFLVEEFLPDVAAEDLGTDHDLLSDGVLDSFGVLKLIAWLEDSFGISVQDTDLDPENFRTIVAIGSFVDQTAQQQVVDG